MATIKYIWGSMWGTYTIPCTVKEKSGDKYVIKYFDPFSEENVTRTVGKNDLVFPSYGDTVMG